MIAKLPLWLRIFIIMVVASFVFSVLGEISMYLIVPLLFLVFVFFPGKSKDNPTFFKIIPWLWGLNIFESAILILLKMADKDIFPPEIRQPHLFELASSLLLTPVLMFTFLKRHPIFKIVLLGCAGVAIAESSVVYFNGTRHVQAMFDLVSTILESAILTVYFIQNFRPKNEETSV